MRFNYLNNHFSYENERFDQDPRSKLEAKMFQSKEMVWDYNLHHFAGTSQLDDLQ